ncbi:MAG TPA: DinB family protein [Acidimicrobiales bacterium]|nr:DinB family protein [Acidimicrobiales bacterium]
MMTTHDPKANLKDYLQGGRETLLWKLNGLSDYDIRRPLVPTGTNLLGLVKHKAHSELIYFGETFGRPSEELSARFKAGVEPNADFWATAEEPRQQIVELYQRVWAHSDATIDALALDSLGHVPHWAAGQDEVTLHEVMVHVIVDTQRHAGHADIIRELIDGTAGLLNGADNLPSVDQAWWDSYRNKLQRVAEQVRRY